MNPYYCKLCGKKIPEWDYSNKVYCSDYCRKRSYDIKNKRTKPENKENSFEDVVKQISGCEYDET